MESVIAIGLPFVRHRETWANDALAFSPQETRERMSFHRFSSSLLFTALLAFACADSSTEMLPNDRLDASVPGGLDATEAGDAGRPAVDASPLDADVPCSTAGHENSPLGDSLIAVASDSTGRRLSGTRVVLRIDGEIASRGTSDRAGCVEFAVTTTQAELISLEAYADGFVPAAHLADPMAVQLLHLYPANHRIPEAGTGELIGSVENFELARGQSSSGGIYGIAAPVRPNRWLKGIESPAPTNGPGSRTEEVIISDGANQDLEFKLLPREGEHLGFSVAAGETTTDIWPATWLGWRKFELSAGTTFPMFEVELTVPLIHEAEVTIQRDGAPQILSVGFVDVPGIGIIDLPLHDDTFWYPELSAEFSGARLGVYSWRADNAYFRDRVDYLEPNGTVDVDTGWMRREVLGVQGDGIIELDNSMHREDWNVCTILVFDTSEQLLASIRHYGGALRPKLPADEMTGDKLSLPQRVTFDLSCERHRGWSPGAGPLDAFIEQKLLDRHEGSGR
jgi:hypothetical protein